jgi:hypothetical protein
MSKPVEMPRTAHEVVMRMFPFMDQMAAEDAEYIRKTNPDTKTVSMREPPEGLPHGLQGVFDAYISWNARRQAESRGLMPDEAERQYRAYMAAAGAEAEVLARSLQMEYACSLNFRLNGEKVFFVADALTERLAHTEANLRCAFLHLPFPSFQMVYTSKLAIDLYYNHIGTDGRRVGDRKDIDYKAPITVFVTRLPADNEAPSSLLLTTFHAREISGRDPAMHAASSRQLNIDPDWDIEAAIRTDWKKIDAAQGIEEPRGQEAGNSTALPDAQFYQEGFAFYRMVMNTILYLTSTRADREELPASSQQMRDAAGSQTSSKHRKRLERGARFASDAPFEYLGRSVQPIDFGSGTAVEKSATRGAGSKIGRRFLVRGHWKSQAYGAGRKERKTIYIEPYAKGPEISDLVNRPYLVRKDGRKIIGDEDID